MSLLHHRHATPASEPALTTAQLDELAELDAILAGDDSADAALVELVRDVRAAAPSMPPAAAQHLNERVSARFGVPHPGSRRGRPRRWLMERPGIVALSAVGASMIIVATGVAVVETSRTASSGRGGATAEPAFARPAISSAPDAGNAEFQNGVAQTSGDAAQPEANAALADAGAAQRVGGTSGGGAQAAPRRLRAERLMPTAKGLTSTLPGTGRRAVERSVQLDVRVRHDALPATSAAVQRITRAANGYVATSDVSLGQSGAGGAARFVLRVDSSRLDRAVDQLAALGTVQSQQESSRDITSAVDGAAARLQDATGERAALLAALARASTAGEIASLRARIAENRRTRARLDATLQRVQRRADRTTIELTLTAPAQDDPASGDGAWTLRDAAADAWGALRAILGGLLVVSAVAVPFLALGAGGWGLWQWRRRMARERILDANDLMP
jgi:hypothetical protein